MITAPFDRRRVVTMPSYAHSVQDKPESAWETLEAHLEAVARRSASYAGKFGAEDWGRFAGELHDIGKASQEFQARLHGSSKSVDHSTAGARIAADHLGAWGLLLAYAIAGHHAGLANGTGEGLPGTPRALDRRLDKNAWSLPDIGDWQAFCTLPKALSPFAPTKRPDLTGSHDRIGFSLAFRTRMLFSALVDADRLATEEFYRRAAGQSAAARGMWRPLHDLKARLDDFMSQKSNAAAAIASAGQRLVQTERAKVLGAARRASQRDPGLFSLTVPTGGGKTLASLTFALDHAIAHGLDRVIYVIPFTSIIEQTASVFRDALGSGLADQVIEHHSAFREDEVLARLETAAGGESSLQAGERLRFATENWDAPIVVTTGVQFFESLFSNRPGRCRKLHNIARSVIILDEAQTLPQKLLRPTLAAIEELALHYKTTAVLCTATQPAVGATRADGRKGLKGGLADIREIVDEPQRLYRSLARVTVQPPRTLSADALAGELAALDKVLCIVGTRAQARDLFKMLGERSGRDTTFHLSALMCPAHRTRKLADIRAALDRGPARVVATTVVEAGVDIDFPCVWRQMAGLDSIAQAAGRCNREGKRTREQAIVQLFEVDGWNSIRELRPNEQAARNVLRRGFDDVLGLEAIEAYFEHLFWQQDSKLDTHGLLAAFNAQAARGWFPFADTAQQYRLIESVMEPLIVSWDDKARAAINALGDPDLPSAGVRAAARRLQPYIVNVPRDPFDRLRRSGRVEAINLHRFDEQFLRLGDEARANIYSEALGLDWGDTSFRTAESNLI
jgi:CRISPR-associated endonuclease/helicase Cas3